MILVDDYHTDLSLPDPIDVAPASSEVVADVGAVGRAVYNFALFGGLFTHAGEMRAEMSRCMPSDAFDRLYFLTGVGGGGPGCHRDRGGELFWGVGGGGVRYCPCGFPESCITRKLEKGWVRKD